MIIYFPDEDGNLYPYEVIAEEPPAVLPPGPYLTAEGLVVFDKKGEVAAEIKHDGSGFFKQIGDSR